MAFDVGIDRIQLLHQAELVVIVLGIVDLILKTLTLNDMSLELVEDFTVCKLLDFFFDDLIITTSITSIFTRKCTLFALMLLTEGLFLTPLLFHLIDEKLVGVDLIGNLRCVTTLISIYSLQVFHEFITIFYQILCLLSSLLLDPLELLSLLQLSLVLATGTAGLQLLLKLRVLFIEVFLELLVHGTLGRLVLVEHLLEVGITLGQAQLILKICQLVLLLGRLFLGELLSLQLFLSLILSQVLLQLLLDLGHDRIHLLLLHRLNALDVLLHILQLFDDLFALLAASIELTSKQLVLTSLILLHHVLNVLHLVLQLVDEAVDFVTTGTLLLENVTHGGTLVVSAVDLLLENSVLLGFQILHGVFSVVFEGLLELSILNLAPVIKLSFPCLRIFFALLLLLVLSCEFAIA